MEWKEDEGEGDGSVWATILLLVGVEPDGVRLEAGVLGPDWVADEGEAAVLALLADARRGVARASSGASNEEDGLFRRKILLPSRSPPRLPPRSVKEGKKEPEVSSR